MLTYMAQWLSSFFISKNVIKEEERQIYDYCFEVLLSTVINFMAVVILALFTGTVVPTLYFLVGFIGIRTTAGGFHAETHRGCLLILISSYASFLFLLSLIPNVALSKIAMEICIISWLLVVIFSPVEDYNKPFRKEEYKKFKMVSNLVAILLTIIVLVLVIFFQKAAWGFSIAAGMCVVSLSLIAGTIKNKLRQRRQNGRE